MMPINATIASFLLVIFAGLQEGASSFISHGGGGLLFLQDHGRLTTSKKLSPSSSSFLPSHSRTSSSTTTHNAASTPTSSYNINWSPQDLTKDNHPNFLPIPTNDYIKRYQANPKLWPVEFFVIAYRHHVKHNSSSSSTQQQQKNETQILVRKSANGTSKYGVGTGVPVTRWMIQSSSSQSSSSPPRGYEIAVPEITFDASNFPEFPKREKKNDGSNEEEEDEGQSWSYTKIDICEDAFSQSDSSTADTTNFEDAQLQEYASNLRIQLQNDLEQQLKEKEKELSDWDFSVLSTVKSIIDKDNSVAAIQGSFRMSGLFAHKENDNRYVNFDNAPDPTSLAKSTRIYTMFPQMPDPMPLPTSSPEDLKEEIISRPRRMKESGRDPHMDKYGRVYTHISTSNVSNTIHGVYITFDATDFPELDEVPAFDLFGTKPIKREWVSLDDLKVTEEGSDGRTIIGECDTKPEFISGFIVRQLIRDGVIGINVV